MIFIGILFSLQDKVYQKSSCSHFHVVAGWEWRLMSGQQLKKPVFVPMYILFFRRKNCIIAAWSGHLQKTFIHYMNSLECTKWRRSWIYFFLYSFIVVLTFSVSNQFVFVTFLSFEDHCEIVWNIYLYCRICNASNFKTWNSSQA